MTEALPILLTNLIVTGICFTALWLISIPLKDPSYVDSWWALGVVVLAWSTFVQLIDPGPHAIALLFLATAWGLRLGIYLFWRWASHGVDRRYAKLAERAKQKHGLNFAMFSLLWVFAPQLVLQFIVGLPAQLGPIPQATDFGVIAYIGLWLSIAGLIYEGIADAQLAHFKSLEENKGKVMNRGLWRYSRHPNYFGDMVAWWGMWLIALDAGMGLWSIAGPLLLTFLLTRVSGGPTTEPHLQRTRPDYEAYKKRTSAYIPMPPKKA